jgi:pSer/pThr/pTyr-binding forkhead associated (FHA) protein
MTPVPDATRIAAGALLRGEATAGPRLVVRSGPDAGRALAMGTSVTVGRAREADLKLSDPAASRLHARFSVVEGRVLATDLRSKNGLLVNGIPFRAPRPLEIGDELAIGSTRLTLEAGLLDAAGPQTADGASASPTTPEDRAPGGAWSALALLTAAVALVAAALLLAR